MITYCQHCWAEAPAGASICSECQATLVESAESYTAKLIAALRHPELLTQRRAAYILGLLHDPEATEALAAVLTTSADPYVKGEAVHALGLIGGERVWAILREVVQDRNQSVMVRRSAAEALNANRSSPEGQ